MPTTFAEPKRVTTYPPKSAETGQWSTAWFFDPKFKQGLQASLDELESLEKGWDAYGAPPIDRDIIRAARRWINQLPPRFAIRRPTAKAPIAVPLSPGNLQIEWRAGKRGLELEFETPTIIHYLKWDPASNVAEEDTFAVDDIARATELIEWFITNA